MRARLGLRAALGGLAAAAALAACQLVARVEEKEYEAPLASPATVPGRPAAERTASNKGRVVAVVAKEYFFGARRPSDRQVDENAWRDIGFDLDGLCTKKAKIDASNPAACILDENRLSTVLEDGVACRDNSFGRNVSTNDQLTQSGDLDALTNLNVQDGTTPTYLLVLSDYDDGDDDDPYVPATLYLTESTPGQNIEALWDESTLRAVAKAKYEFPDGYRRGDLWVSGDPAVVPRTMPFVLWKQAVEIDAQMALITLRLRNGGRGGAIATVGLALPGQGFGASLGPLVTDLLLERRLGGDAAQCAAAAGLTQGLLSSVASYVDLAQVGPGEGAPVDKSAPCSMLSVGFVFEAVPTQAPRPEDAGATPSPPQRLCALPGPASGAGGADEEASGAGGADEEASGAGGADEEASGAGGGATRAGRGAAGASGRGP